MGVTLLPLLVGITRRIVVCCRLCSMGKFTSLKLTRLRLTILRRPRASSLRRLATVLVAFQYSQLMEWKLTCADWTEMTKNALCEVQKRNECSQHTITKAPDRKPHNCKSCYKFQLNNNGKPLQRKTVFFCRFCGPICRHCQPTHHNHLIKILE